MNSPPEIRQHNLKGREATASKVEVVFVGSRMAQRKLTLALCKHVMHQPNNDLHESSTQPYARKLYLAFCAGGKRPKKTW
jgi:hypothetical protein